MKKNKTCVVYASSFNRVTGVRTGRCRRETICFIKNSLFKKAYTILEIKKIYEDYWNNTNKNSQDVVFVSKVVVL